MPVITTKTLQAKEANVPAAPKTGELAAIINKIKGCASPTSEISRLCDQALTLVK